jgi:hypothetical protein
MVRENSIAHTWRCGIEPAPSSLPQSWRRQTVWSQ